MIALSYIYAESWQVSPAHFVKAFSQCSTTLVCLGKCTFNIYHQRLQAVNVQLEALTLCPAAPLDFTKAHFFSSILSARAPPLFAPEQRRLLILKQPTFPNALRRIRLIIRSPWSGCDHVHLKGILVYSWRVDGKWILYFLVSSFVSSLSRRQSGRKQGNPAPTWKWDESLSPHPVVCLPPPSPPLTQPLTLPPLLSCRQVLCIQGRAGERRAAHRDD